MDEDQPKLKEAVKLITENVQTPLKPEKKSILFRLRY